MKDLKTEIEKIVREYKLFRLKEREKGRINKVYNSENIFILNEIINKLESVLGYSVSIESSNHNYSVEDRLRAIGDEN
jgi:hypothetical protein